MKKLINKFKFLSEDPIASTEECENIAIAFGEYLANEIIEYDPFSEKWNCLDCSEHSTKELFDKFIEEEYGK